MVSPPAVVVIVVPSCRPPSEVSAPAASAALPRQAPAASCRAWQRRAGRAWRGRVAAQSPWAGVHERLGAVSGSLPRTSLSY